MRCAGASYLLTHLNGESIMKEWNPRLAVTANYFINSKNQLYFDLRWNNSSPQSAWVNDALVRQDELMWIKGNPDMRNMYGPEAGLTYSFVPLNFFSMSADLRYGEYRHMPVYEYTVEKGIDGIVRSFSDNNTDRSFSATLSATANLFRNSLILNIGGGFARQWLTGVHPLHINVFTGQAYAAYYTGPLGITLYYFTPQKSLSMQLGSLTRTRCNYGLMASYSLGNFKAELSFRNWFSKGRIYESFNSDVYSSAGWFWSQGNARSLNLTLTYTFNYGKKVERNEDLENSAFKRSAILK